MCQPEKFFDRNAWVHGSGLREHLPAHLKGCSTSGIQPDFIGSYSIRNRFMVIQRANAESLFRPGRRHFVVNAADGGGKYFS